MVERRPDITFTTQDDHLIDRLRAAWTSHSAVFIPEIPGLGLGYVLEMNISSPAGDWIQATVTVRPTGAPMKEEPVNELRKYYVGRQGVARSTWARKTLADAIEHAKTLVEETGEEQVIVKVIRVVRRAPQPIIVEIV